MSATAQEFQKMASQYNELMMDSWSSWTKQTIQSDSFTSASGAFMDWSLATHKMMTELSGQFMESLDIPKRSDLARISAQVQSVETRMLEQEDAQEDIRELLTTIVNRLDNLSQAPEPKSTKAAAATAPAPEKVEEKIDEEKEKKPKAASKSKSKSGRKSKKTKSRSKSKSKKASK